MARDLQRFRALAKPEERARAIRRLGPVRDPRVTVALMEVVQAEEEKEPTAGYPSGALVAASFALYEYHIPENERLTGCKYWQGARIWWETHEAEVRQRAARMAR